MIKVKIEGRVDYEDGSSSESESDVSQRPDSPPMVLVDGQGEEEEIEYFGEKNTQPRVIAAKKVAPKASESMGGGFDEVEAADSRLASILSRQVHDFEQDTTTSQNALKATQPPAPEPTPANSTDEFGITYQSKRKQQSAGAVSITALEDFTADIEARLLQAKVAAATEEDDEFDLDEEPSSSARSDAILQALENAATAAERETTASIAELEKKPAQPEDTEIILKPEDAEIEKVTAASIMQKARKAFAEVADVYGSGLGDQEVVVGSTSTLDDKGSKTLQSLAALKEINVIEEGDEEAAELEETQEEQREAEMRVASAVEKSQLESEWDGLEEAPKRGDTSAGGAQGLDPAAAPMVKWSFNKSVRYFRAVDHAAYRANIVVREDVKGGWFSSAPRPISYKDGQADLELPFLIAQIDYDPQCVEHLHMLCTLYSYFLADSSKGSNVPNATRNWEKLGFQGSDPRTDLNRSMKMLSVVQLLSFIEQDGAMARRVFDLSQSASDVTAGSISVAERNARAKGDTSWPFLCVAIMFTKEALQALRRGVLNDKCNKRSTVFGVINEFHRACFAEFESLLREQPAIHHAMHLATLRKACESNPLKLLKKYKAQRAVTSDAGKAVAKVSGSAEAADEGDFRFDNLESVRAEVEGASGTSGAGESSGWSNIFGGGERRASKFAVSEV